ARTAVADVGIGRILSVHRGPYGGGHQVPELPVQEVRVSELHLPEIKRDEIVRSLSEVRLPTLDLAAIERPRIALPESIRRFDWRSIDLAGAVAGAAAIARLGRPPPRRLRPPPISGAAV